MKPDFQTRIARVADKVLDLGVDMANTDISPSILTKIETAYRLLLEAAQAS